MQQYKNYKPAPNVDATDKQRGLMTSAMVRNYNLITNPPRARVFRNANVNVPHATFVAIQFTATSWNTAGASSGAVPWVVGTPTRFTAPITGQYAFTGRVQFQVDASQPGRRITSVYANGVNYASTEASPAGSFPSPNLSDEVYLLAGQYLELYAYQEHPTAATVVCLGGLLTVRWVHP